MKDVEYVLPDASALSPRDLKLFVAELQVMMFQKPDGVVDPDQEWSSTQLGCIAYLMNKHKLAPVVKK